MLSVADIAEQDRAAMHQHTSRTSDSLVCIDRPQDKIESGLKAYIELISPAPMRMTAVPPGYPPPQGCMRHDEISSDTRQQTAASEQF